MLLGFALPVSGSWATPANCAHIARRAEALGYASLWTFQRLLSPVEADGDEPTLAPQYRSVQDPLAVLAYATGHTSTVRLGVAVVNMPYYAPVVLAKQLTTIDHLSGGRLDVGLGIGWLAAELEAVGRTTERRGARAEDYLRCLTSLWTDEIVDYDGEFYRVPRARVDPKPLQRPHPPVLLGGGADPALRRAGRLAAGWISGSQADLSRIDQSIETVRQGATAAAGTPTTCGSSAGARSRSGPASGRHSWGRSTTSALTWPTWPPRASRRPSSTSTSTPRSARRTPMRGSR